MINNRVRPKIKKKNVFYRKLVCRHLHTRSSNKVAVNVSGHVVTLFGRQCLKCGEQIKY